MASFSAQVGQWVQNVQEAQEAIFNLACQYLVHELDSLVPVGPTGFLRASLVASTTAMPQANRPNPGSPVGHDNSDTVLAITAADLGETVYLGYTANYGPHVHYGTSRMQGRPWVDMVSQRWQALVARAEAEVKARFAL